jgi:hypothetical protein
MVLVRLRGDLPDHTLETGHHISAIQNVGFGEGSDIGGPGDTTSTARCGASGQNPSTSPTVSTRAWLTKATSGARTVSGSLASLNPFRRRTRCRADSHRHTVPSSRLSSSSRARAHFLQGSVAAALPARAHTGTRRLAYVTTHRRQPNGERRPYAHSSNSGTSATSHPSGPKSVSSCERRAIRPAHPRRGWSFRGRLRGWSCRSCRPLWRSPRLCRSQPQGRGPWRA